MSRTPLARVLQAAAAEAATGCRDRSTRRELLRRGAVADQTTALGRYTPAARGAASPRIVIVGPGSPVCRARTGCGRRGTSRRSTRRRTGWAGAAGPVAATSRTGSCTSTAAS